MSHKTSKKQTLEDQAPTASATLSAAALAASAAPAGMQAVLHIVLQLSSFLPLEQRSTQSLKQLKAVVAGIDTAIRAAMRRTAMTATLVLAIDLILLVLDTARRNEGECGVCCGDLWGYLKGE